jgi:hypothetical protein
MRYIDVFNGDADGLCALHQLRLAEPLAADAQCELVTGLKRDIELLARVTAASDTQITVLDVSLDRNRAALERLLEAGASVRYFDHHYSGAVPSHPRLQAVLDPAADVCTGMLVDRYLGGRYRLWAVVAAFGDNLSVAAESMATKVPLGSRQLNTLRALGEALNYNAYGETEVDIMIHPRELYLKLHCFVDPFEFAVTPVVQRLIARNRDDLASALAIAPISADENKAVYRLPNADWSRRVMGAFANALVQMHPHRAHAVIKENADQTLAISVRAPLNTPFGADRLCLQFKTGGGRTAAAGIERLPLSELPEFLSSLDRMRWTA